MTSTAQVALRTFCLCLCILATTSVRSEAQDASVWKVQGKLLGKVKHGDAEKSTDVSGIACDRTSGFPRLCVVADDETQGAQIVVLKDGELIAGDFIKLMDAQFAGKPLELDAEGVAFEEDSFYVTGSHGRPRHESDAEEEAKGNAKAQATRQLFRITLSAGDVDMDSGRLRVQPAVKPSVELAGFLQRQSELGSSYDSALNDNGLTVEGIAIRDSKLYVGMRGPVIGANAAVLAISLSAIFEGQQATATLHSLALEQDTLGNPRGVRDLTRYANDFLVLAGPVNDPPDPGEIQLGDYSIYIWDGQNSLKRVADLPSFGTKVKPEALLPLDGDLTRARVLLMFDGPKEGAPRPVEIKLQ